MTNTPNTPVPATPPADLERELTVVPYDEYVATIGVSAASRIESELDVICTDANVLIEQSGRAVCTSREEFGKCGDLIKLLKARLSKIEALRTERAGPINKLFKALNKRFADRAEPMDRAVGKITDVMRPWAKAEEERVRKENAERIKQAEQAALDTATGHADNAQELRAKESEAANRGDMTAAQEYADGARALEQKADRAIEAGTTVVVAAPEVRREKGMYGSTSGVRKTWQTKVVNVAALPGEYIDAINANPEALDRIRIAIKPLVDAAIKAAGEKAVQDGNINVPGLKVTHESDISVR